MRYYFLLVIFISSITAHSQSADKLGIVKHNHIGLHVKDIQASTKFYRETLGLQPIPVPDDLKAIRSWFKLGEDQQIHLLAGRTEPVVNDRNGGHFAVFVESIDQAEAFLKKRNIAYHPQVRFDGVKQIYITDPDGYVIELNQISTKK
ncbi:VOC family protein [Cytophagaceae bacterium YF14B1]|uniref:VOC family protein n=1 Tax=Xanthocytophaga flava TaxID=3048013 RepID=A0AAE3QMF0_9BACT|nr:VOC family protein [Xanthocytophaga flavus]MDJ1481635.1 VOC family protein [Xanthocytophaga flavus]